MIFHYNRIGIFFILSIFAVIRPLDASSLRISNLLNEQPEGAYRQKPKDFKVRVLLDEKKNEGQWIVTSSSGILVTDLYNHRKKNVSKQTQNIICFTDGNLFINGKKLLQKCIRINALKDHLMFDNKIYQGSFLIIIEGNTCFFINQIDLEDYVYCVLRSESWPGWPLEVNKVFAIASRTYVITKVLESNNKKPFHIKNTNIHQTYNGFHSSETLKKAVEETKGLIVTYGKKPILAMFDCCCGGIIPADLSGIDFKKSPYLARSTICDFCKPCKIYQWNLEIDAKDFEKMLQAKGFPIYSIKEISTKKDNAGSILEVAIQWAQGITTLTGKQFYALSTKIKSYCYTIELKLKKIYIKGKGYGHHCGICQWGARHMIDQGWNYRGILKFFYPGTTCMKLTLK